MTHTFMKCSILKKSFNIWPYKIILISVSSVYSVYLCACVHACVCVFAQKLKEKRQGVLFYHSPPPDRVSQWNWSSLFLDRQVVSKPQLAILLSVPTSSPLPCPAFYKGSEIWTQVPIVAQKAPLLVELSSQPSQQFLNRLCQKRTR